MLKGFLVLLEEFCLISSLHGLYHIVAPRRSIIERVVWLILVFCALYFSGNLFSKSWTRFQKDPTVITLNKNYQDWKNPLPGTTFCFTDKLNNESAVKYIQSKWNVTEGDERFQKLFSFLYDIVNLSLLKLEKWNRTIEMEEMYTIDDLPSLILQVQPNKIQGSVFNRSLRDIPIHQTMIDIGVCYSFNSLLTMYLHPGPRNSSEYFQLPHKILCDANTVRCYGRLTGFSSNMVKFYVHPSNELAHTAFNGIGTYKGFATDAKVLAMPMKATRRVRDLRPKQRRCRFFNEGASADAPFYTYELCIIGCRRDLAIRVCDCIPFFFITPYPDKKNNETKKICGIKDIICLKSNHQLLSTLVFPNNKTKYNCNCMANCEFTSYKIDSISFVKVLQMGSYGWEIVRPPRTMLVRDIIYGLDDLSVSCGGIVALFLGSSVISLLEIIYFIISRTVRKICRLCLQQDGRRNRKMNTENQLEANNFKRKVHKVRVPYKMVASKFDAKSDNQDATRSNNLFSIF